MTPGVRVVVGLGNPGEDYRATRHNLGFEVVDRLAAHYGARFRGPRWGRRPPAEIAEVPAGLLLKPLTYMNLSGEAVARCLEEFEASPADALHVCDDLNLPLGVIRVRPSGSAGGHHGLESVLRALGTDAFPRLRIGIGGVEGDAVPHVLGRFRPSERPVVEETLEKATSAARAWLEGSPVGRLMNEYNRKSPSERPQRGEE